MKWFEFSALRGHLLALIFLAPIPAVGLVVYNSVTEYRTGIAEAKENALRAVKLAAVSQKQVMGETQHVLEAWTKLPLIAHALPAECNAFLGELLQGSPRYANFGLIRQDGQLACSALPFKPPVNMSKRAFFQRAVRTRGFVVGDYEVGLVSGRPSLYLAQPVVDEAGSVRAVLYAALDLVYLNRLLVEAVPQRTAVVVLFNSKGVILGQYPDTGKVGQEASDAPLVRAALAQKGEGVAEVAGLDGISRLYAFTTLSRSSEQDVYLTVTIGIPTEAAFANARRVLYRQLAVVAVTLLLILAIIWVGTDRLILRRLTGLLKAAEEVRAGNLRARSGIAPTPDELGRLARTFDGMAASLERREAERSQATQEIRQLNEELERRVEERTRQLESAQKELEGANQRLTGSLEAMQRHSQEAAQLAEMSSMLQSCRTVDEANAVVAQFAQRLFPAAAGALCLIRPGRELVDSTAVWGDIPSAQQVFAPDDCWALRSGKPYAIDDLHPGLRCGHVGESPCYMCVPLSAHGEIMGILHLRGCEPTVEAQGPNREQEATVQQQLAGYLAERAALAIANLRLQEKLMAQAIRDSLTKLYNRRYMEEVMAREELRAQRASLAVGIIMLDVDHFKAFNDIYGHPAGDAVLRQVADFLHKHMRGADIACRYGGEEFVVIMPGASLEIAGQRAEALRQGIEQLELGYGGKPLRPITISLGVACFPEHGASWEAALKTADAALYRAKAAGRNCVVIAAKPHPDGTVSTG